MKGLLKVESNGKSFAQHKLNRIHPIPRDFFTNEMKAGSNFEVTPILAKVTEEDFHSAILKTAYLLIFAKYGYSVVFLSMFEKLRAQIFNPSDARLVDIYSIDNGMMASNLNVPILAKAGQESFLILFSLTSIVTRSFAVFIPFREDTESTLQEIRKSLISKELGEVKTMNFDYFSDTEAVRNLQLWISEVIKGETNDLNDK